MDRDTLFSFIERYKSHSCLWDVSHVHYMNRNKRIEALEDLAPLLGEDATIDTVRKRIDMLRNCYNRELKKVNASTLTASTTDEIYTPTLWYFDRLSFLSSTVLRKPYSLFMTDVSPDEQVNTSGYSSSEHRLIQRKKQLKARNEMYNVAKMMLTNSQHSQKSTFGSYLDAQLDNISNEQRFLAEKLMSEILYMARKNYPNESSTIVTDVNSLTADEQCLEYASE